MSVLRTSQIQNVAGAPILNSTGGILQVLSVTKTDTFSTTVTHVSGGIVIPGLTVTITPTNSTNKILITAVLNVACTSGITQVYSWLARGSTKIGVGGAAGSRITIGGRFYYADNNVSGMIPLTFLDSPGTTDPVTYNVYIATQIATGSVVVNRTINDTDNATDGTRSASTLTLMEVAA